MPELLLGPAPLVAFDGQAWVRHSWQPLTFLYVYYIPRGKSRDVLAEPLPTGTTQSWQRLQTTVGPAHPRQARLPRPADKKRPFDPSLNTRRPSQKTGGRGGSCSPHPQSYATVRLRLLLAAGLRSTLSKQVRNTVPAGVHPRHRQLREETLETAGRGAFLVQQR